MPCLIDAEHEIPLIFTETHYGVDMVGIDHRQRCKSSEKKI